MGQEGRSWKGQLHVSIPRVYRSSTRWGGEAFVEVVFHSPEALKSPVGHEGLWMVKGRVGLLTEFQVLLEYPNLWRGGARETSSHRRRLYLSSADR